MASQVDSTSRTFTANAAISAFRLVRLHTTENEVVAATNGAAIGFTQDDAAAGQLVGVKLFHPTYMATVSAGGASALAVGGVVHATVGGAVASAGGVTVGFAINAGVSNDIVEVAIPVKSF
jgi:hypothetical protein